MPKYHKHTKESLSVVVNASSSWAEVCRKLDRKGSTGLQSYLRILAEKFLIDTSHFTGQAWRKGKRVGPKKNIESYLTKNSISIHSDALKKRLIREGIFVDVCARCGSTEWFGESVTELDHINGDHHDNRLENLQLLCSNCHTLKTRKDRKLSDSRGCLNLIRPYSGNDYE